MSEVKTRFDTNKSIYQNWHGANQLNWNVPAIEYFSNQWTFEETDQEIDRYARSLSELRQDPESSVTFCTPTLPSTKFGFFALNKLGIRANFISDAVLPTDASRYLDRTKTETLVVFDQFYSGVAREIAKTGVKNIVVVSLSDNVGNIPSYLPDRLKYALSTSGVGEIKKQAIPGKEYFSLDELVGIGSGKQRPVESVYKPGETSVILYTGGSTGIPKGVEKTDADIVAMGNVYADPVLGLNLQPGERNGIFIPPNHPTSLINSTISQWLFGTTNVLQPVYNKLTFPEDIYNLRLNIAVAAPSHYATFPNSGLPDGALSFFRLPMCGGEAVNEYLYYEINQSLERLGVQNPLTVAYGMSEVGPLVIMIVGHRTGKPVLGAKARLIGLDGKEIIGPGRGLLEVSAPETHMKGYFQESGLTRKFWTVDIPPYARTGDFAERDENGYYDVLGRGSDYYTGADGEIHYLFDIERFVYKNKNVLEAEAVKLVLSDCSEVPVVFLVLKGDIKESEAEVIKQVHDMCQGELSPEERPVGYYLLHEFGTNPISTKRDYQSLSKVREGYYNHDGYRFRKISFPEEGDVIAIGQDINASDVKIH